MARPAPKQDILYQKFSNLTLEYDATQEALWCRMHAFPRPCFTPGLLAEARSVQNAIRNWREQTNPPLHYVILASSALNGVFNLGGDLASFAGWIESKDRSALTDYAHRCVEVCYHNAVAYDASEMTTIALVQGDALGGGFEAAMSANYLVAERRAQFGLPEILFNLYAGMGAFTLLTRRVGVQKAEEMLRSGQLFSATQMHELGIVDILCEDGEGQATVKNFIASRAKARKGHQAIDQAKRVASPIRFEELREIVDLWVDVALKIDPRDIKMMRRLVERQNMQQKVPVLLKGKEADRRSSESPGAVFRQSHHDQTTERTIPDKSH